MSRPLPIFCAVVGAAALSLFAIRTVRVAVMPPQPRVDYDTLTALCESSNSEEAIEACMRRCDYVSASVRKSCEAVSGLTISVKRTYPKE